MRYRLYPLICRLLLCTAVWPHAKVQERGLGLRPRLDYGLVCDDIAAQAVCAAIVSPYLTCKHSLVTQN